MPEETVEERLHHCGHKLAHSYNQYIRALKPRGYHIDKEMTPAEGMEILSDIVKTKWKLKTLPGENIPNTRQEEAEQED